MKPTTTLFRLHLVLAMCWPLFMLLALLLAGCAGPSAADRWFIARADLTTAQETVGIAHDAGWIDDATLVDVVDPAVQTARRYLDKAFTLLPEGGDAFDHLMLLLDAAIAEMSRRAQPPG